MKDYTKNKNCAFALNNIHFNLITKNLSFDYLQEQSPELFYKKVILENLRIAIFAIFTGKHLYWSLSCPVRFYIIFLKL